MSSQQKKRKYEGSFSHKETLEEKVFQNMTEVNSGLITLNSSLLNVDYSYMLNHGDMVDEFVVNIHQFLEHLGVLRKRLASERLNTDTISCIYQFLDTGMILKSCQYVSKMWCESLKKSSLSIQFNSNQKSQKAKIAFFKNLDQCRFSNNITSLSLHKPSLENIKILCKSKRLKNLHELGIKDLGVMSISELAASKRLRPKVLTLEIGGSKLVQILSTNFVENVETLTLNEVSTNMQNLKLVNLTNLEIKGGFSGSRIGAFKLMHYCPKLKRAKLNHVLDESLDGFEYPMLETLEISHSKLSVALLNQFCTRKFPQLKSLKLLSIDQLNKNSEETYQKQDDFKPLLEEIHFSCYKMFPNITLSCNSLKKLNLDIWSDFKSLDFFQEEALSTLEELTYHSRYNDSFIKELLEGPYFPNLRVLKMNISCLEVFELLKNCTTLINLENLQITRTSKSEYSLTKEMLKFPKLKNFSISNYGL